MQLGDLQPHLHAQLGIEIGERLVEQEDLRLAHDGAADRDALALAAGKLPRLALPQLVEMQDGGRLVDALLDEGCVGTGHPQSETHVLLDRHMRIERIGLEHHGDAAVGRVDGGDVAAADRDGAAAGLLEAGDQAQQGRFSAARRADEHDELAIGDRQVDAMDDMDIAEGFADALEFQTCHACSPLCGLVRLSAQAGTPCRP